MIEQTPIPYTHESTQLEGFSAYIPGGKRPLVILCHAWRGRDDFICEKAQQIATLGFVGFALDLYGKGAIGKSKEENAALKKPFLDNRLLLQKRLLRSYQTATELPYVDASRVAVVGFGFGGLCALDLARSGAPLKGAVSIYGHFEAPQESRPITAKVLLLHGYKDPIVNLEELHAFEQQLDSANADWQSIRYGRAVHAFATPTANDPASGLLYDPLTAQRAWKATESFLKEVLA